LPLSGTVLAERLRSLLGWRVATQEEAAVVERAAALLRREVEP
jgi:hypothetical protein